MQLRLLVICGILGIVMVAGCNESWSTREQELRDIIDKEKIAIMIVQPFTGHIGVLTSGEKILLSDDWGKDWKLIPPPGEFPSELVLTANGNLIVYKRGSTRAYFFDQKGNKWERLSFCGTIVNITGHLLSEQRLIAIISTENNKVMGHLYESDNKGKTWFPVIVDKDRERLFYSVLFSRDRPGQIMALPVSFSGDVAYSTVKPRKWEILTLRWKEDALDKNFFWPSEGALPHHLDFSEVPNAIRSELGFGKEWLESAITHLIEAMKFHDTDVRRSAGKALKRITGQDIGEDYDNWKAWFEKNKDK